MVAQEFEAGLGYVNSELKASPTCVREKSVNSDSVSFVDDLRLGIIVCLFFHDTVWFSIEYGWALLPWSGTSPFYPRKFHVLGISQFWAKQGVWALFLNTKYMSGRFEWEVGNLNKTSSDFVVSLKMEL